METLRRLASSVFDVHRDSLNDTRLPDARSLDITFVADRLAVMGTPSNAPTDKKRNVVNVDDLAQFLDAHHRNHFMVFNLNALLYTLNNEHESVADKLHEQLLEFNWERDGMKAHTPPLDLIYRICYALHAWILLDPQHIALVNCQSGKTRSGVVVACYLLFARLVNDPMDAFVEFYKKRWDMKSLTSQVLRKKTPPSIQRFLTSFHELLKQEMPINDNPLLLKAVIFRQLPVELQPCVQIWDDYKLVYCTNTSEGETHGEAPVLDWNEEDGFFAILWENGIELDGGFSILCSFGANYDNVNDMDASSKVLFRYANSTFCLAPGLVTLKKHDLDLMKQYEHGFDGDLFSVDLVLHENSAKKPPSLVGRNLTGNNAVRQGLIEMTKHHVILPDPAMHSKLKCIGFSDTPATFALQCSQNAPNLALDLLHTKGFSRFFAQEAADVAATERQESSILNHETTICTKNSQQTAGNERGKCKAITTRENLSVSTNSNDHATPTNEHTTKKHLLIEGKAASSLATMSALIVRSSHNTLNSAIDVVTNAPGPPKLEIKSAMPSDLFLASRPTEAVGLSVESGEDTKCAALKSGASFKAIQSCLLKDGAKPSALLPIHLCENCTSNSGDMSSAPIASETKLKNREEYARYFRMLRMGCPREAVKQKMLMDGLDPVILEHGSNSTYNLGKDRTAITQSVPESSNDKEYTNSSTTEDKVVPVSDVLMKDYKIYSKYYKMRKIGLSDGAIRQKMKADGVDERAVDLGSDVFFCNMSKPDEMHKFVSSMKDKKLRDDPKYAKYFKMLQMGLTEEAVRKKMISESVDERALDLGGDEVASKLVSLKDNVKLQDDPGYSKYFKKLKNGPLEGALKQKMVTENFFVQALELGPEDSRSQLHAGENAMESSIATMVKPKRARKKLHWQAISEERISNINKQTIWEDENENVNFEMDMEELEALFFANSNTRSAKSNSTFGQSKPIQRKQTVTLIDGKRAMNAAISLARVKLSYSEIADAVAKFDPTGLSLEQLIGISEFLPTKEEIVLVCGYVGDKELLGEAEKFITEIAKLKRYASRMDCLVYKSSFTSRSADLSLSVANLQKAAEEVKGSRLLKTLLAMVLKLGNTLNGSGEENEIKGFTVDSLLRLGQTKAVNQKTTVLHYLVRLIKKNHPQILNFQEELPSVSLAARESFETIDKDFKKLKRGLATLYTELKLQEKENESHGPKNVVKAMQTSASEIEDQMEALADIIASTKEDVLSVLDYFGEDPKRCPSEFFATLASFCSMFQRSRNEVDSVDEAERLKMRRLSFFGHASNSKTGVNSEVHRPILERMHNTVDKQQFNDN
ncbi:hypothetical protein CCR75_001835 [Bremia lactucae]|uniref:Formin-like protein n=1 Tax=Bremia lactucae TaxID=4779 RepID=A0A976FGC1_BRELC|nr:hypothetical protein CCR75_001835 [Bremia lactucae]